MSSDFDFYRRVSQIAFEFEERHGSNAHLHAAKLAAQAQAQAQYDEEDDRLWSAVEATLRPRVTSC